MKRLGLLLLPALFGCSTLTPYVRDASVIQTAEGPALLTTRCELRQTWAVWYILVYVEPDTRCTATVTTFQAPPSAPAPSPPEHPSAPPVAPSMDAHPPKGRK